MAPKLKFFFYQNLDFVLGLSAIQSGQYLPLLAEVSSSRDKSSLEKQEETDDVKNQMRKHRKKIKATRISDNAPSKTAIQDRDAGLNQGHVDQDQVSVSSYNSDQEHAQDQHALPQAEQERLCQVQLQQFWVELEESATRIDKVRQFIPVDFVVPKCNCGKKCSMVKYSDYDADTHDRIFVCDLRKCMFWKFYECIDSFGNVINRDDLVKHARGECDLEEAHKLEPHTLERNVDYAHALQHDVDDAQAPLTGAIVTGEKKQDRVKITQFVAGRGLLTLESFWDVVFQSSTPLDDATAKFICHQIPETYCRCNLFCNLCICKRTGHVFAVCPDQTCFSIFSVVARDALLQMDVGQVVTFGSCELDRYTTLTHLMAWFGNIFTLKYMHRLQDRAADADFLKGSYHMRDEFDLHQRLRLNLEKDKNHPNDGVKQPDQIEKYDETRQTPEYDVFLSYRGAAGARWIWLSLCGHWNAKPAFWFMFGVCPILVLIIQYAVRNPCKNGSTFFVSCPPESQLLHYDLFSTWGCAIIVAIILLWNPLCSWIHIPYVMPRKKIFFDKYC